MALEPPYAVPFGIRVIANSVSGATGLVESRGSSQSLDPADDDGPAQSRRRGRRTGGPEPCSCPPTLCLIDEFTQTSGRSQPFLPISSAKPVGTPRDFYLKSLAPPSIFTTFLVNASKLHFTALPTSLELFLPSPSTSTLLSSTFTHFRIDTFHSEIRTPDLISSSINTHLSANMALAKKAVHFGAGNIGMWTTKSPGSFRPSNHFNL